MLSQQQIIALAVEAGFPFNKYGLLQGDEHGEIDADEMFARLAALLLAKETQARQAAQLELEQYRNEAQQRAGVLIKEAYQRGVRDERNACLAEIETGIWMDKTTEEVLAEIAEAIRARSAETKES